MCASIFEAVFFETVRRARWCHPPCGSWWLVVKPRFVHWSLARPRGGQRRRCGRRSEDIRSTSSEQVICHQRPAVDFSIQRLNSAEFFL